MANLNTFLKLITQIFFAIIVISVTATTYAKPVLHPLNIRITVLPDKPIKEKSTIYQISTINKLSLGQYDGKLPSSKLVRLGTIGIGTFDQLNGELVVLDQVYQMTGVGKAREQRKLTTPFAVVAPFKPTIKIKINHITSLSELQKIIGRHMKNKKLAYAFRINGNFSSFKTRTPHKQFPPYKPLTEALANQTVTERFNIKGDAVGFWFPEFVADKEPPGFHTHFISAMRRVGGHVLDLRLRKGTIELQKYLKLNVIEP